MWFCKKKKRKHKKVEPEPPIKIGQRFKYLGIDMICARHWVYEYPFKVIAAEYVNKCGEIKHATFCPIDWDCLEMERKRK